MRCILIDDNPTDLALLEAYAEEMSCLQVVHTYTQPLRGIEAINRERPDLLFLDYEMADISGLHLLDSLVYRPMVILVTSYPEIALAGYEYDVVDFLLKPVGLERFIKSVGKAQRRQLEQGRESTSEGSSPSQSILLKSGHDWHRVTYADMLCLEASGNYVDILTKSSESLTVQEPLNHFEESLPGQLFMRVHRSFIINLTHVRKLERHQVWLGEHAVPTSRSYRKNLEKALQR